MTKITRNVGSPHRLAEKLLKFFTEKELREGFFIEAGANNGIWQSNTFYLEEALGWNGLLVEPSPHSFEQCQINRPSSKNIVVHSALVDFDHGSDHIEGFFAEKNYENALMAQVQSAVLLDHQKKRWSNKELVKVPAKSLSSILDEHEIEKVDFLSLDVEGYEISALKGVDFEKHRPSFICVEVWENYPTSEEVLAFLPENGYKLVEKLSKQDYLFVDDK
jgi:FkbM family methyltransferase